MFNILKCYPYLIPTNHQASGARWLPKFEGIFTKVLEHSPRMAGRTWFSDVLPVLLAMHACVMMYPVWVAFVLMNTESCHTSSSLCPHGFLPCLPLSNTWVTFIAFWSWKKSVYGSTFTAFTSLMLAFLSLLSLPSNDSPIFDM